MGRIVAIALLSAGMLLAPLASFDFENGESGKLPPGWAAAKTGEGPGSVWQVNEDPTAPLGAKVLAQVSAEGPRPLFNLCVANDTSYRDLDLSVQLKAVSGKIDQGGGPVWRYQDPGNYYICRFNPLENNFRVYKVIAGQRTQLATADAKLPPGQWLTIRITQSGDRIRCYLNGELKLEARDAALPAAGKIGLWTKADAVTSFDALQVMATQP
ncbi:MAG: DUF1080 domain-containing protein [Planctomycetes bacterium]|nr:DUF1080 domain-containing protein [Planctomycetota bacterium]